MNLTRACWWVAMSRVLPDYVLMFGMLTVTAYKQASDLLQI